MLQSGVATSAPRVARWSPAFNNSGSALTSFVPNSSWPAGCRTAARSGCCSTTWRVAPRRCPRWSSLRSAGDTASRARAYRRVSTVRVGGAISTRSSVSPGGRSSGWRWTAASISTSPCAHGTPSRTTMPSSTGSSCFATQAWRSTPTIRMRSGRSASSSAGHRCVRGRARHSAAWAGRRRHLGSGGVEIAELDVADAWVCTPRQFPDDRGVFLEWFRADLLAAAVGRRFVPVQANHSVSRAGTLRGLHYADVPPGQAKYVYCSRGAVLDVVVDIRQGSPTYGAHAAVRLDDRDRRGVFLSEGLAHGFCALTDTADVTYLVSTAYNPNVEHAIDALDPALALPWPTDVGPLVLSEKDAAAPSLQRGQDSGVLPSYERCRERYRDAS